MVPNVNHDYFGPRLVSSYCRGLDDPGGSNGPLANQFHTLRVISAHFMAAHAILQ